ncbi:putative oxidoreductase [Escovopsis weberi]|uniref:Putative oxidoreductase n=1 Tax=Escovopsis weberi TaxID=150374 RepID=A0A0M8MV43_ESCWE|nr:putative oxidoreductase [Escovopsis weberi]
MAAAAGTENANGLAFNCALITGGAGGIGKSLAQYFISKDKKIIIAGKTESKLRESAREIGADSYYVLDTGNTSAISGFVDKVTTEHEDLDCLVNNAGIQKPLEVSENDKDDFLDKADQEINVNIRGPMHLALGLLPHFRTKPSAAIINVSSILGFVPFSILTPVYNGTKAWLHSWTMNFRAQLQRNETAGSGKIRVLEIVPPLVESDLHRDRGDPDDNKKEKNPIALTTDEFMRDTAMQLERGNQTIAPGLANEVVKEWFDGMGSRYE